MKRKSKKARVSVTSKNQDEDDRLSSLPDEVVEHILSFLPTFDAVRTTILAHRFCNLWTSVRMLSFSDCPFNGTQNLCFYRFVNEVLWHHKGSVVDKFDLSFSISDFGTEMTESFWPDSEFSDEVGKLVMNETHRWVKWALCRNVKVLSLTQCAEIECDREYNLPDCIWNNQALIELRLCGYYFTSGAQATISMASLKILTLTFCSVMLHDLLPMIDGCPLLEELSLIGCPMLRNLRFLDINILKLKLVQCDDRYLSSSIIDCPNLRAFDYKGVINKLELVDLSSLDSVALDVEFSCRKGFAFRVRKFRHVLKKIQHVKTVSLSTDFVAMFTCFMIKNICCPFNCWKHVVLNMGLTPSPSYIGGVYGLLRNSPLLEEFTLYVSGRCSARLDTEIWKVLKDPISVSFSDWNSHAHDYMCLRQHLKKVTIIGYGKSTSELVLRFAETIIRNASVLDKLVIKRETESERKDMLTYEELFKFTQTLCAFPRASTRAAVLVS